MRKFIESKSNNNNNDNKKRHFRQMFKGNFIFRLDDCCFVENSADASLPMMGKLVDIFLEHDGDETDVQCAIQWFYRYSDLQSELILGCDEQPSELSRHRELWSCTTVDANSASLVRFFFLLKHLAFSPSR
jgi:hypothetical protein